MKDSYRFLAPVYSKISALAFGKTREVASISFLEKLDGKRILIIGGGDGSAFKPLAKSLSGHYWELSPSMLHLAKWNLKNSGLSFHLGEFQGGEMFDFICLPFVLDTFLDEEFPEFLQKIRESLAPSGRVFLSDFFPPQHFSQKLFHQGIIWFHRMMTNHRRNDLPHYTRFFDQAGFSLLEEKNWKSGWIRAQLYEFREA